MTEDDIKIKVTLELNEEQTYVVMTALDILSRIECGQIDVVSDQIKMVYYKKKFDKIDSNLVSHINNTLKRSLFPELTQNEYHSIYSNEVHKTAKIAWDIYQVIRYYVSWKKHPNGGITVNFDTPLKTSNEPLPTVHVEEDK
jgi:hypothetical protein